MDEHVILVHGLWLRAFTLAALHRRLEREGYAVHSFDYASVFNVPDASIGKLVEFVRSIEAAEHPRRIHFVCHSLGGLMALRALGKMPDLVSGCVVCLGSPLRGSAASWCGVSAATRTAMTPTIGRVPTTCTWLTVYSR